MSRPAFGWIRGLGLALALSLTLHLSFFSLWELAGGRLWDNFNFQAADFSAELWELEALSAQGASAQAEPESSALEAAAEPESLEALEQGPAFRSYYTRLRGAVARRWILPPGAADTFQPGRLTVDFTLDPEGRLTALVVVASSGSASLDHAGLEALRSAAPFPPFPSELAHLERLTIRLNFDYRTRGLAQDGSSEP